jgi:hypothetical protein
MDPLEAVIAFIYNCSYTWGWPPWGAETCCVINVVKNEHRNYIAYGGFIWLHIWEDNILIIISSVLHCCMSSSPRWALFFLLLLLPVPQCVCLYTCWQAIYLCWQICHITEPAVHSNLRLKPGIGIPVNVSDLKDSDDGVRHRITGISGLCPSSGIPNTKKVQHFGNRICCRNVAFSRITIPENGQSPQSQ